MDVVNGRRELVLGGDGGVVRELRLVSADDVVRGVDDRLIEGKDRIGPVEQPLRQTLLLQVEPDTNERAGAEPGCVEFFRGSSFGSRTGRMTNDE